MRGRGRPGRGQRDKAASAPSKSTLFMAAASWRDTSGSTCGVAIALSQGLPERESFDPQVRGAMIS